MNHYPTTFSTVCRFRLNHSLHFLDSYLVLLSTLSILRSSEISWQTLLNSQKNSLPHFFRMLKSVECNLELHGLTLVWSSESIESSLESSTSSVSSCKSESDRFFRIWRTFFVSMIFLWFLVENETISFLSSSITVALPW